MNDDGERLEGNVGGVLKVGDTVHRPVGVWTPAVHALLDHLAPRLLHDPPKAALEPDVVLKH